MILPFYVNFEKNPLKNELMKQKSQTKSFPSNNLFTSHMVDWLFIIHFTYGFIDDENEETLK